MLYKTNRHYNAKARQILNGVRAAVNAFSIASNEGALVVTDEWRPPKVGYLSYNPKHQAEDWRCNDKPNWWIDGVVQIIKGFKEADARLQYDLHGEGDHLHIHIEYDTGDPI